MTKTPIAVLENDLGKNSCSLAGLDAATAGHNAANVGMTGGTAADKG